jgi:hypothetical protein
MIGGGMSAAGNYFPHDEFYDTSTRDIITAIAPLARSGAVVACETPSLFEYYAEKAGRKDLIFISLSGKSAVAGLSTGDLIVLTGGRRYFSNAAFENYLEKNASPSTDIKAGGVQSSRLYQLDETSLSGIKTIANQ